MSEKHTPLPWRWDGDDLWHFGESYEDADDPHRYTGISIDKRLRDSLILKENMALIVAAVNSYPPPRQRLVSALQFIAEHGDKTLINVELGQGYSAGANAAFASMAAEARSALAEIGEQK